MSEVYPVHRHSGESSRQTAGCGCAPFLAGILIYLLIAIRQPLEWTQPIWIGLAFFLAPLMIGLLAGAGRSGAGVARSPFRVGLLSGAWAMACYAGISMMLVYRRLGYPPDGGLRFLIGLFVTLVYALLAGLVAGLASWAIARLRARGGAA